MCSSCKSFNSPLASECDSCGEYLIEPRLARETPNKALPLETKAPSRSPLSSSNSALQPCRNCGNSNPKSAHNCLVCRHVLKQDFMNYGAETSATLGGPRPPAHGGVGSGSLHNFGSDLSAKDYSILRGQQLGERLAARSGNPWSDLMPQKQAEVEARIRADLLSDISGLVLSLKQGASKTAWKIMVWFYGLVIASNAVFLMASSPKRESFLSSLVICLIFAGSMHLLVRVALVDRKLRTPLSEVEAGVNAGRSRFAQVLNEAKYSSPTPGAKGLPKAVVKTLTPREAENFCAAWLIRLGHRDAQVTRFSRDGGIDVQSQHVVAQVKHQQSKVGVKPIRELYGVAAVASKRAVFFTLTGYSSDALDFANKVAMPLFVYQNSELQPCNTHAELFAAGRWQ